MTRRIVAYFLLGYNFKLGDSKSACNGVHSVHIIYTVVQRLPPRYVREGDSIKLGSSKELTDDRLRGGGG